jgi:hypothetical protein
MIHLERIGDLEQKRRLPGLGGCDDQTSLALPDRRDQIEDPRRDAAIVAGEDPTLVGVDADGLVELIEDLLQLLLAVASRPIPISTAAATASLRTALSLRTPTRRLAAPPIRISRV